MPQSTSRPTEEELPLRSLQDKADELPTLSISLENVCFIIFKAREFSAKVAAVDPDDASNPTDDMMISILEDNSDDPVLEELTSFIASLSEDEQIDLVALAWLGRDDYTLKDWYTLREEAARAHSTRPTQTAEYLLGMPLLSDYLDEALSQFGLSCDQPELTGHAIP